MLRKIWIFLFAKETGVYRQPTHTDQHLVFDSHHPICHKKPVVKKIYQEDWLSTIFTQYENWGEKIYFRRPKGKWLYQKKILRNCQKPVTTSNTPDQKEPATGFAVIPYI